MLSISCPELVYFYHQVGKPVPRQVVEPSAGVRGVRSQSAGRSTPESRRQTEGEGADFPAVFSKALGRK